MISLATGFTFLLAVTGLFLTPGPNMAFVIAHAMAHGRAGGLAAALGIGAADLVLTAASSAGLTALLVAWPPGFALLRLCGAAYLCFLAVQALRRRNGLVIGAAAALSRRRIFYRALLSCLCNPKALLFFTVFLPQFVDVGRGSVSAQLAVLGLLLSAYAVLFNAALAQFSGRIGRFLDGNPTAVHLQGRLLALVFAALAAHLLLQG